MRDARRLFPGSPCSRAQLTVQAVWYVIQAQDTSTSGIGAYGTVLVFGVVNSVIPMAITLMTKLEKYVSGQTELAVSVDIPQTPLPLFDSFSLRNSAISIAASTASSLSHADNHSAVRRPAHSQHLGRAVWSLREN